MDMEKYEKRSAATRKPRRPRGQGKILVMQVYQAALTRGLDYDELAAEFGLNREYARWCVHRGRKIMRSASQFDPQAANLQREMLKFVPLAAEALRENLEAAEPRVTLAFLQGVGALVPRQEIDAVTDEDRLLAAKRSLNAINPKLRKALDITDDVSIETVSSEDRESEDEG